jgi:hypothetical protein
MPNNSTCHGEVEVHVVALDTVLSENSAITNTLQLHLGEFNYGIEQNAQFSWNKIPIIRAYPICRRRRRQRNASGWTPESSALHNQPLLFRSLARPFSITLTTMRDQSAPLLTRM